MLVAWSVLALLAASQVASSSQGLRLPERLKGYRAWRTVAAHPFPVSDDLAMLCVAPSAEQKAESARKHGPHDQHQIQVFTNSVVSEAFYSPGARVMPSGSIVVKEKSIRGAAAPVALAVMIKGAPGSNPASDDWEFLYVTPQTAIPSTAACVDCHRAAPADFLFRSYPRETPK
jgi:hypothetical protein